MRKFLFWLFAVPRYSVADLFVFALAVLAGGWTGAAIIVVGMALSGWSAGFVKAWEADRGRS